MTNHPIQKSKKTKYFKRIFETQGNFGNNKIFLGQFEEKHIKKGALKLKKFGEIVAAATIGDYLVNTYLLTIYSLINRLL